MADDFNRAAFRITPDKILVQGVVAAAQHFGERKNLDETAVESLMRAAGEACESTFQFLSKDAPTLAVIVAEFTDRIELSIEHQGEALPTAGLDTFLSAPEGDASPGELSGSTLMTLVDRVQYQTSEGTQRMILVKNAPSAPSKP